MNSKWWALAPSGGEIEVMMTMMIMMIYAVEPVLVCCKPFPVRYLLWAPREYTQDVTLKTMLSATGFDECVVAILNEIPASELDVGAGRKRSAIIETI